MFFLFSMKGSLVNKRDLLALYLSGTVTRPVQEPLAVLLLDNRLYIPMSHITRNQVPSNFLSSYFGAMVFYNEKIEIRPSYPAPIFTYIFLIYAVRTEKDTNVNRKFNLARLIKMQFLIVSQNWNIQN